VPLTGQGDQLYLFAWQIGWQATSSWMAPTERCSFGGVVLLRLICGVGLYRPRHRRLEGQHALLDHRHALLATSPTQAMRQQLHPLAERRVLFVEPIDLVAEFVEDCLGLCAARHHHTTTASVSKHRRPRCREDKSTMRNIVSFGDVWLLVPHALAHHLDPFEQQVQLASVDFLAVEHGEGAALQAFVQQPKPIARPHQKLHPVSATIEEGEDMA
jgi:hypothetical protein